MKFNWIFAVALLATPWIPQLRAQGKQASGGKHHHYKLIDMGTLGGPLSGINEVGNYSPALNSRGQTVGFSATANAQTSTQNPTACFGPTISHGFEFSNGSVHDLGSLGGEEFCSDANSINEQGVIQGVSENGLLDTLLGFNQVRAVVWRNGNIKDLGTLGGNDSWSFGINNRAQVVGMALNNVPDPLSLFGFMILGSTNGTQTRAFLWDEKSGMQDLGTLGGNDAWAWAINERGQILGWSYTDSAPNSATGFPTLDPFFYDKGKMRDVGTLGGVVGFPIAFNNRGQVIGGSSTAASPSACWVAIRQSVEFSYPGCDPYLWENGVLTDLSADMLGASAATADAISDSGQIVGAATFAAQPYDAYVWDGNFATDLGHLDGDCFSEGFGLNLHGQIVGNSFSCPAGDPSKAFLWEGGSIVDLNNLIPENSTLHLVFANAVNERGEIAGVGVPVGSAPADIFNVGRAFLLIPCDDDHPGIDDCDYKPVDAIPTLPDRASAQTAASKLPPGFLRGRPHFSYLANRAR
jgi:probable HAF family extracellular repeat protein